MERWEYKLQLQVWEEFDKDLFSQSNIEEKVALGWNEKEQSWGDTPLEKKLEWEAMGEKARQDGFRAAEQMLNSMGDQGWELVSIVPQEKIDWASIRYFKRPTQEYT